MEPPQLNTTISKWYLNFEQSALYDSLSEQQQLLSEDIVSFFCEYMAVGSAPYPTQWNPDLVEEVLVYGFPAYIAADENYFAAVRPVLQQFLAFMQADDLIDATQCQNLQLRIDEAEPMMLRNAFDQSCWGLAKSMVMQAWEAGIDPTNDEALASYFESRLNAVGDSNQPT